MSTQTQSGIRMVVGGNRGIGLALVTAQLAKEDVSRVIATHRPTSTLGELEALSSSYGEKLVLHPLDVAVDSSIEQFAHFLDGYEQGIDLTIHAAGLLHDDTIKPEKSIDQCNTSSLKRLFEVNSLGPLMVARALLPKYPHKRRFTFAALSAMVGSIADNRLGGVVRLSGFKVSPQPVYQDTSQRMPRQVPEGVRRRDPSRHDRHQLVTAVPAQRQVWKAILCGPNCCADS